MKCPQTKNPKSILFIYNNKNKTGSEENFCYNDLEKSKISCLEDIYNAIVILDGSDYKQLTSHSPKFYITDSKLPVVTISYLDQEKAPKLASANGIPGSVLIDSIDKILDADDMFNSTCDTNACYRFEVFCFEKLYSDRENLKTTDS